MNVTRRTMLGLPGMLLAGGACRAQGATDVWAAWAASPFEIVGPEEAHGVFLYLHAEGLEDQPLPLIFAEMAKVAKWDVLRINRRSSVDIEANDAALLEFVSGQVDRVRRTASTAGSVAADNANQPPRGNRPGPGSVRRTGASRPCPCPTVGRREDKAHRRLLLCRRSR